MGQPPPGWDKGFPAWGSRDGHTRGGKGRHALVPVAQLHRGWEDLFSPPGQQPSSPPITQPNTAVFRGKSPVSLQKGCWQR